MQREQRDSEDQLDLKAMKPGVVYVAKWIGAAVIVVPAVMWLAVAGFKANDFIDGRVKDRVAPVEHRLDQIDERLDKFDGKLDRILEHVVGVTAPPPAPPPEPATPPKALKRHR